MEESAAKRSRFSREFGIILDEARQSRKDFKAVLRSEKDLREASRRRLEQALINSGLITAPTDSRK